MKFGTAFVNGIQRIIYLGPNNGLYYNTKNGRKYISSKFGNGGKRKLEDAQIEPDPEETNRLYNKSVQDLLKSIKRNQELEGSSKKRKNTPEPHPIPFR